MFVNTLKVDVIAVINQFKENIMICLIFIMYNI